MPAGPIGECLVGCPPKRPPWGESSRLGEAALTILSGTRECARPSIAGISRIDGVLQLHTMLCGHNADTHLLFDARRECMLQRR